MKIYKCNDRICNNVSSSKRALVIFSPPLTQTQQSLSAVYGQRPPEEGPHHCQAFHLIHIFQRCPQYVNMEILA